MILADWCVLVAMFLPWGCAVYGKYKGGALTLAANHYPRDFFAKAEGVIARANAAQQNGYEIFAPFAFAVLLAQFYGHTAVSIINFLSVLFIISRMIYIWCYLTDRATLRSLVWGVGIACILGLFVATL